MGSCLLPSDNLVPYLSFSNFHGLRGCSPLPSSLRQAPFRKRYFTAKRNQITCSARETRTPHSGYHFDGSGRRFFEGWYFKISIPQIRQSFAWMYSIEDPGTVDEGNFLEATLSGPRFPGVGAQILGVNDQYLYQFDSNVNNFWASKEELALGCTFASYSNSTIPVSDVSPETFDKNVKEGFQVSTTWHQGRLVDNGQSPNLETVKTAEWAYSTRPIYGWGSQGEVQKATAGWLAALPAFEPHWQICMAGGLSSGSIQWGDSTYKFSDAPSYVEKNWGGSFPQKWFWVQCNVFDDVGGEVALTAGGGKRGTPFLPGIFEEVAMVGVHYGGKFYEFVPWNGFVEWEISPWGTWKMKARSPDYEVELEATTDKEGTVLRAPTADNGLHSMCKDTFFGDLSLCMWQRTTNGTRGKLILKTRSNMAALEVGGGPWWTSWKNFSEITEPRRSLIGLPIDVGSILDPLPIRPPGL